MTPGTGRFSARSGPATVAGLLLGNLGIGLSCGWWVAKHNRHHAHPNTEDADPDIAAGALVFTAAQAQASRGAARLVYRYQAYLFFPMLLGEAIGLHVASIRALRSQASRHRSWEAALLAAHVAGYLTVVFPGALTRQGHGVHPGAAGRVRPVPGLFLRP